MEKEAREWTRGKVYSVTCDKPNSFQCCLQYCDKYTVMQYPGLVHSSCALHSQFKVTSREADITLYLMR